MTTHLTPFRVMWIVSILIAFVVGLHGGLHAILYLVLGTVLGAIMWMCHLYDMHRKVHLE